MNGFMIWLDTYKTYLAAIALPVITLLVQLGTISPEIGTTLAAIIGVITGGGKIAIDSAIKNADNSQDNNLGAALLNARIARE
jgi:hypothetical protein